VYREVNYLAGPFPYERLIPCYHFSESNTMMGKIAKKMISRNFSRIQFTFREVDWRSMKPSEFGLYVHVPFCTRLCSFCPFYKVLYQEDLKEAYLQALLSEIEMRRPKGVARWLYLGGGTPNLLDHREVGRIISALEEHAEIRNIGMEGNPAQFTDDYIRELGRMGVHKISTGVETLNPESLNRVNREKVGSSKVQAIVEGANDQGIKVNIDLMVGLPGQSGADFLSDVEELADIGLNQITTYPFMTIPGVSVRPEMSSQTMFEMIEKANKILLPHGYSRDSIWIFSRTSDVYDSSGDELVRDYLGFGPAAFSRVADKQVVNPPLQVYLDMMKNETSFGLVSEVDESADIWRKFAHQLYGLELDADSIEELPTSVKLLLGLLKLTGNVSKDKVTEKGRRFVHDVTKTVVETLPFPLSNPEAIKNLDEYHRMVELAGTRDSNASPPT